MSDGTGNGAMIADHDGAALHCCCELDFGKVPVVPSPGAFHCLFETVKSALHVQFRTDAPSGDVISCNKVSSGVNVLFDDRLESSGLSLCKLAVFAATLEHLTHSETMARF